MATHTISSHLNAAVPAGAQNTNAGLGAVGSSRLLDAAEVADLLGVPRSFIYALARRNAIPTVRLGERYIRFRPDAITAWVADQEQAVRAWGR